MGHDEYEMVVVVDLKSDNLPSIILIRKRVSHACVRAK